MLKNFLDIFRYSELIKALVSRDLKVRYKNSVLGYIWTWLDPLMTMIVFILVFDLILSIKVENFPVFLLTGLLPWIFFSNSINASTTAITGNVGLIKRVYYPREIFPLTNTLGNLINMFLGLIVLLPIILIYEVQISLKILLLPIPVFFLFLITYGVSLIISCFTVFFRDMSYVIPFIIRLGFYLTPIFYTVEGRIPEKFLDLYMYLNPLAVLLTLFRGILMGYQMPPGKYIISCFLTCSVIFAMGYLFFKSNEDRMVKRI